MSDEINQQRQCQTCSVCFLTNDDLRAHLDGYQSQERLLSENLERCRAHSSQLNSECECSRPHGAADSDIHDSAFPRRSDKPANQLCCPHEDCVRSMPFSKRQRLVRHFAKHVRCKEVCVYCFEVFTLASQYIAHADTHRDADVTKNSYTRQICDRLRQDAATSLDKCQLKGVQTKKRTRELAESPGARRIKAKLDVDDLITNPSPSHFSSFIGINSLPPSEASVPASAQLFAVAEPAASDASFVGASGGVPIETLNESYGAPIFWALTYPSNHVAEQFSEEIGGIQTSIMDPLSDLGVSDYNTTPQGVFGHPQNRAEEYYRQS